MSLHCLLFIARDVVRLLRLSRAFAVQRKTVTEKYSSFATALDVNTSSLEAATVDVKKEVDNIQGEFEELLPVIHSLFVKIGCEKMFAGADDTGTASIASVDTAEDATKPHLPAMFSSPAIVQTIRSGVSVHSLPLVRCIFKSFAFRICRLL